MTHIRVKRLETGSWHYPPVFYKLRKTGKPENFEEQANNVSLATAIEHKAF